MHWTIANISSSEGDRGLEPKEYVLNPLLSMLEMVYSVTDANSIVDEAWSSIVSRTKKQPLLVDQNKLALAERVLKELELNMIDMLNAYLNLIPIPLLSYSVVGNTAATVTAKKIPWTDDEISAYVV